ncbi:hypothetical protein [Actinokineospora diospyrosa]|uniref:Glycerophosphoryl diester phosphodiesterase family protein n=1 Tax=Actinokineospora diospyrosa TaxID=103728 RepID=A0ABT1IMR6_9PSEU|nr:hypothetical protein [Actinokineospora diospyrosa]MCP2273756.1 hypothetical protein [Actinokineospora diospyrosa]
MTDRPDQPEPQHPSIPEPRRTDHTGAIQLGIVALRPLHLPDFVGGMFGALRRNAGALLGVSFGVSLAAELLRRLLLTLFVGDLPPLDTLSGKQLVWADFSPYLADLVITAATLGLFTLLLVAVVNVVVPRAVFGHTTSARHALGEAGPTLGRLIATAALLVVIFTALIAVAVLPVAAAGAGGILISIPALVGLVYLSIAFTFARAIAVVEGLGPSAALDRSRKLVHAVGWWRLAGITALVGFVLGLITVVVNTLFARISGDSVIGEILAVVLAGTFTGAVSLTIESLLYVDYRARSEGIDGLWLKAG